MTFDLSTFGEGQLRLTVTDGARLLDASNLLVSGAGSEANVAGLLSQLGRHTAWASVLPEGDLGDRVLVEYRSAGVDLTHVHRVRSGRVALYFLEPGGGGLPAAVTYDREGTPFRDATPQTFDWDSLLDTRCLLVTGITAALTTHTAGLVRYAVEAASANGVPVALDVNYRSTLWNNDDAHSVLAPLLDRVWALFCSRRDAETVFSISGRGDEVASALADRSSAAHVICTDGANAVHYVGAGDAQSLPVDALNVIDRPGAGDALVGGTIHGLFDNNPLGGIAIGIRAAAIALTRHGDLTRVSARDFVERSGTDIDR